VSLSENGVALTLGAVAVLAVTGALRRRGSRVRRSYDRIGAYESVLVAMDGYFKDNIPERRPWSDEDEAIESTKSYYDSLFDELIEFYKVDRVRLEHDMPDLEDYLGEIREKFRPKRISFRSQIKRGSRDRWDVAVHSEGFEGDATFRVNAPTADQATKRATRAAYDQSELDEWEIYRGGGWEIVETLPPVRIPRHSFREPHR
jgi:hypothetical protein